MVSFFPEPVWKGNRVGVRVQLKRLCGSHTTAALQVFRKPPRRACYQFTSCSAIGYSGNILANWNAPSEDVWTVPIGLGLAKVVKFGRLTIKIQLAVQHMPVHPRVDGQEWNVQVSITPVIPKLIKCVLLQ